MKRVVLVLALGLSVLAVWLGLSFFPRGSISPQARVVAASNPGQPTAKFGSVSNKGGNVTVQVTPPNLSISNEPLTFKVAMNTHSVALTYDLAQLAVLRTDSGNEVQALSWDGPTGGGHHASGKLIFPSLDLQSAQRMDLVIRDVAGVPERVFSWDLR